MSSTRWTPRGDIANTEANCRVTINFMSKSCACLLEYARRDPLTRGSQKRGAANSNSLSRAFRVSSVIQVNYLHTAARAEKQPQARL